MSVLGVIGGSGLYDLPGIRDVHQATPDTPFGSTSGPVTVGVLGAQTVCFLPRHGTGHRLSPTEVPYRANVYALKQLGVTHLLSISAVGSLQEKLPPGAMVIPDQIIDRTMTRERTFFEGGVVAHVSMADPFCADFRNQIWNAANATDARVHAGGTYVCIEGPQFSTRAESNLYRSWNADVIGMTAMPEARLAREAGICYAIVATITDYDVWHDSEDDVSVEAVLRVLTQNAERGKQLVSAATSAPLSTCHHGCADAASMAIATDPATIPDDKQGLIDLLTSSRTGSAG